MIARGPLEEALRVYRATTDATHVWPPHFCSILSRFFVDAAATTPIAGRPRWLRGVPYRRDIWGNARVCVWLGAGSKTEEAIKPYEYLVNLKTSLLLLLLLSPLWLFYFRH